VKLYIEKNHHKKRVGRVAQDVSPEFKPKYHKKKRKKKERQKERTKEKNHTLRLFLFGYRELPGRRVVKARSSAWRGKSPNEVYDIIPTITVHEHIFPICINEKQRM
jgi:hypothetical protein